MLMHECQCPNHDCRTMVPCVTGCPTRLHLCAHCDADRLSGFKAGVDAQMGMIFRDEPAADKGKD